MDMTLERELTARVFLHKVAIVRSAIVNSYMAEELSKGGVTLPIPSLEQNALDFSDSIISKLLFTGNLDEAYNKAWECIGELMPDDFCVMD